MDDDAVAAPRGRRRRGWLALATVVVALAIIAGIAVLARPVARARAWRDVMAWDGRDLGAASDAERAALLARVEQMWPETLAALPDRGPYASVLVPELVARAGDDRVVVVVLRQRFPPRESGLAIIVADGAGHLVRGYELSAGSVRTHATRVETAPRAAGDVHRIVVIEHADFHEREARTYALADGGDRLALVRLEVDGGRAPWGLAATAPADRDVDGWVRALRDGSWVARLEALEWIAAAREPAELLALGGGDNVPEDVVHAVRADARTREVVAALTASDDAWTADAARRALAVIDGHR